MGEAKSQKPKCLESREMNMLGGGNSKTISKIYLAFRPLVFASHAQKCKLLNEVEIEYVLFT